MWFVAEQRKAKRLTPIYNQGQLCEQGEERASIRTSRPGAASADYAASV